MEARKHILCFLLILIQVSSIQGDSAGPSIDVTVTPPDPDEFWVIRITCTVNPGPGGLQHDIQIGHPNTPNCVSLSPSTGRCTRPNCSGSSRIECEPSSRGRNSVTLLLKQLYYTQQGQSSDRGFWSCQYGQHKKEFKIAGNVAMSLSPPIYGADDKITITCGYIPFRSIQTNSVAIYPPWVSSGSMSSQGRCAVVRTNGGRSCAPILGKQCTNPALGSVTCRREYHVSAVKLVLNLTNENKTYHGNWSCVANGKRRTMLATAKGNGDYREIETIQTPTTSPERVVVVHVLGVVGGVVAVVIACILGCVLIIRRRSDAAGDENDAPQEYEEMQVTYLEPSNYAELQADESNKIPTIYDEVL